MNRLYILYLFAIAFFYNSCNKDQYLAEVPSYLRVESIDFESTSIQGSSSTNITDVWITMDGQFLGAFELPCTVPILDSGEHDFNIYAGIKANGISATRIRYPFYKECDVFVFNGSDYDSEKAETIHLYRDSMVVVKAAAEYVDDVAFLSIEDFEDAGTVLDDSDMSDTSLIRTNVDSLVFEGYGSGEVHLDEENSFFELISAEYTTISSLYNANFLELNYKCDHSFKVGVAIKNADSGVVDRLESLQINPSENWNKIYVYLSPQIGRGSSSDEFGIFIGTNLSPESEKASFYFDNIKWLHEQ